MQKRAIPGTRLRGLTLGVRASSFADELVWQLEVCVSGKRLPRWMNTRDSEWNRVAGTDRWFVTELSRPRGTGHLTIDHFRDIIEAGRGALRRLHLHTKAGKWHAYGEGAPPHAPRLKIPELRAGLQIWEPVSDSIDRIVTDTLRGVCAPHDERERPFRAREGGWRTFEGAIPHGRHLFGERVDGIGAIAFTWTPHPDSSADTLQQALQVWPSELPVPEFTPDHRLRIPLQADTFNHPKLVPELVRVLSALSTH